MGETVLSLSRTGVAVVALVLLIQGCDTAATAPMPPSSEPVESASADPRTTTTTIAETTTTPAPPTTSDERGWLVIHGTGDVNLDSDIIGALRTSGYSHAWSGLDGLFVDDDPGE